MNNLIKTINYRKSISLTLITLLALVCSHQADAASNAKKPYTHWPKVQTFLQYPTYRGRIVENSSKPIQISVLVPSWVRGSGTVSASLVKNGQVIYRTPIKKVTRGDRFVMQVPVTDCKVGRYKLFIQINPNKKGVKNQIISHTIHVIKKDAPKPTVWIDNHNRLIVNGKPMMPIGVYSSSATVREDTKLLHNSQFNCALPYGTLTKSDFSIARKNGIYLIASIKDYYYGMKYTPKVIKSIKDERRFNSYYIRKFRDNPALLAWYISDEPSPKWIPRIKTHYRWVKEIDRNHPTYLVENHAWWVFRYFHVSDVVGMDWYKYDKNVKVSRTTSAAYNLRFPSGHMPSVWMVIQAFNYQNYLPKLKWSRTPSSEALRNMVWQAIDNGSNGIILYGLYDMQRNPDRPFKTYWPKVKKIAAELNQWAPILLSIEKSPKVTSKQTKTIIKEDKAPWLSIRTATWHGRTFVFTCNNTRKTRTATFHTSADISHVRTIDVLRGNKRANIPVTNNTWQDTFKPLAVKMYELNGTGKKLPPPQNIHPPKAR